MPSSGPDAGIMPQRGGDPVGIRLKGRGLHHGLRTSSAGSIGMASRSPISLTTANRVLSSLACISRLPRKRLWSSWQVLYRPLPTKLKVVDSLQSRIMEVTKGCQLIRSSVYSASSPSSWASLVAAVMQLHRSGACRPRSTRRQVNAGQMPSCHVSPPLLEGP